MQRPEVLSQQLDGGWIDVHRKCTDHGRWIAGMRLIREWQHVEHTVTPNGYEWQLWPYNLLCSVAWAITGILRNVLGLQNQKGTTTAASRAVC
jgi:hypothetical protein